MRKPGRFAVGVRVGFGGFCRFSGLGFSFSLFSPGCPTSGDTRIPYYSNVFWNRERTG